MYEYYIYCIISYHTISWYQQTLFPSSKGVIRIVCNKMGVETLIRLRTTLLDIFRVPHVPMTVPGMQQSSVSVGGVDEQVDQLLAFSVSLRGLVGTAVCCWKDRLLSRGDCSTPLASQVQDNLYILVPANRANSLPRGFLLQVTFLGKWNSFSFAQCKFPGKRIAAWD